MESVVVAMSGGVDSSVAAALLVEQGYAVSGVMLDMWSDNHDASKRVESVEQARKVADQLKIPFSVLDARDVFWTRVVEPFLQDYLNGLTPSPCVGCNRQVKWQSILEYADREGLGMVATGHYARLNLDGQGKMHLLRGKDDKKDQAYMLAFLQQKQLCRTIFPLGDYTKPEVRQIARRLGLIVAERDDSQDLCFLPSGDYRHFLREHAQAQIIPGEIIDQQGNVLGRHEGLPFYTIGQRKGLGFASVAPMYVLSKELATNQLVVGGKDALGSRELKAASFNWIAGKPPANLFRAQVKIRYHASLTWGMVQALDDSQVRIELESDLRDITPGQVAVIYQDDDVLGGGIIQGR
jgi:tRNA-specific 2-thiouridylase